MRSGVPSLEQALIGPGAEGFWIIFQKFKVGKVEQFVPTWNWPAFLIGGFWFLYRKVYLWAGISIGLSILTPVPYIGPGLYVAVLIGNGVAANYIYYLHIKQQAQKIREGAADESEALNIAQHLGGVNVWAIWVFAGFMVIIFIGAFIAASRGY
jgi:hypothetical protein